MKKFLLLAVLIFISVSCSSKKSKLNDENSSDEDSGTGFDVENSDTDIPAEEEGEEPATDSDNDGKDDEKVEAENEESDPEFNDSDTQLCRFDQCEISGICYEDGEKESGHLCSVCDPQKERFSWSPLESGIICRISSGECDIAEKCDGSDFECPVDSFKPKDEPCGSQTESVCDKRIHATDMENAGLILNPKIHCALMMEICVTALKNVIIQEVVFLPAQLLNVMRTKSAIPEQECVSVMQITVFFFHLTRHSALLQGTMSLLQVRQNVIMPLKRFRARLLKADCLSSVLMRNILIILRF